MFRKPTIQKLLDTALYQATREVLIQQEQVHKLEVICAQAKAALAVYERRQQFLAATQARNEVHSLQKALGNPIAERT